MTLARALLGTLAPALLIGTTASVAGAQWTVVHLNPAGAASSAGVGVDGGQQVGWSNVASVNRASLWSGSAASWVDLTPVGALESLARAVGGGQQGGSSNLAGYWHASLWAGSAGSWVDLHPAAADGSEVWGVAGGQQAGHALIGGAWHASLWSGTAASWVDLAPAAATHSYVYGMSASQQVGRAVVGGAEHASLWSGTAASWVDLHPASAIASVAFGADGGQQVGGIADFSFSGHAGIWSGSAASFVDLSPAGTWDSNAYAADGGQQVGVARATGSFLDHASLWSGSASSWVDLHAFLPAGYVASEARDIWHDGGLTYVAGFAKHASTGLSEAILWVQSPQPSIYCTAKTNSLGCIPAMAWSGTPSATSPTPFDIQASQVLNNKPGLLFYGTQVNGAPFQGGFLCVKAPVIRTAVQFSGGSASGSDCTGTYGYDFNALIQAGTDPNLVAGAVLFSQYWSRDPNDPAGFTTSLSDGLTFTIAN